MRPAEWLPIDTMKAIGTTYDATDHLFEEVTVRQLLGIRDQATTDAPFRAGCPPVSWGAATRRQIYEVNFYDRRGQAGPLVS